jgi:hypothetical protein
MAKFIVSLPPMLIAMLSFSQESKLSQEQEQVWRMEETYWQIVEARDREGYIAL